MAIAVGGCQLLGACADNDDGGGTLTNDEAIAMEQGASQTDLALTLTAPETASLGEDTAWAIDVENQSVITAVEIIVTLAVPGGVTLIDDEAFEDCIQDDATTIRCGIVEILGAEASRLDVPLHIGESLTGEVTISGVVESDNNPVSNDPNPDNNTASAVVDVS